MKKNTFPYLKKLLAVAITALLAASFTACSTITYLANALWPQLQNEDNSKTVTAVADINIAIDPGHGGIDGGAAGEDTGVSEAELNLAVSRLLQDIFKQAGSKTLMTRETADVSYEGSGDTMKLKDMDHRVKLVEEQKPNLLVSIHMNTFSDRSVLGAQVFYQKGSEKGRKLAECIQKALNDGANEKKKRGARSGDYYMLRETSCPGVIVECGFLSNADDEKKLQDPEFQAKLADCIYKGVCAYLGVK